MSRWRIQYFGTFAVWDASGGRLDRVPVKALAVLAILNLSRPYGTSRVELAQELWPDAEPSKQLGCLRGALFCLRKLLSDAELHINRTQCLLSDNFELDADIDSPRAASFMPGFEGHWFDQMRSEFSGDVDHCLVSTTSLPKQETVCDSYVKLLSWYAHQNPDQMFEAMRASIDLTVDLPPQVVSDILCIARPHLSLTQQESPSLKFWCGWLKEHEMIGKGEFLLEGALHQALGQQDYVLATEAFQYLLAAYSLMKRADKAEPLATLGRAVLRRDGGKPALMVAQANFSSHMGNHSDAVLQLEECLASLNPGDHRRVRVEALLGFYEACQCRFDRAEYRNGCAKAEMASIGNFRLHMITTLTDAHCAMGRGRYPEASALFSTVIEYANEALSRHFAVYGQEGLAMCQKLAGDAGAAMAALSRSRRMRMRLNMPYTRWDRQRLGSRLEGHANFLS